MSVTASGAIDVPGRKACIGRGQLHVDRGQLGRLPQPAEHGGAADSEGLLYRIFCDRPECISCLRLMFPVS